jgi:hypothetical protein
MHLFCFFVNEVGWHVMEYNVFFINALWNPKDGPSCGKQTNRYLSKLNNN